MNSTRYNKQDVINDLTEKKLTPQEIAEKHGISVGNVYTIKAVAVKSGAINSRGTKSIQERLRDEETVFTPEMREHIKDLREDAMTTSEITNLLKASGTEATFDDVAKVMSRSSSDYAEYEPKMPHRIGRVIRG